MLKAIQIAYNKDFEKKCRYASEVGFSNISVNYAEITEKSEDAWKKINDDILRILSENNLGCIQSHPHYYNPFDSSEKIDEDLEFFIRQSIISSGYIGAKYCVIHPRTSFTSSFLLSRSLEDNKSWLSPLVECAKKHNTKIAVENMPIFPGSKAVSPLFSSNPEHLIWLCDFFKYDSLGICWDFGHANLIKADQVPCLEAMGSLLDCTHVHNNWGNRDDHAPPVYGNIAWDRIMPALERIAYKGPLTLETHCWYDDDHLLRSFAKHNYDSLVYLESLIK